MLPSVLLFQKKFSRRAFLNCVYFFMEKTEDRAKVIRNFPKANNWEIYQKILTLTLNEHQDYSNVCGGHLRSKVRLWWELYSHLFDSKAQNQKAIGITARRIFKDVICLRAFPLNQERNNNSWYSPSWSCWQWSGFKLQSLPPPHPLNIFSNTEGKMPSLFCHRLLLSRFALKMSCDSWEFVYICEVQASCTHFR